MLFCKNYHCERWSIIAPAFIYVTFVWLVWVFPLPLKSPVNSLNSDTKSSISEMPDHLEGVRIERDGEINKNFRKEILLGEGEFERRKEENPKELLEDIFVRADTNSDGFLTKRELSVWIGAKIQQHINQALADNYILFASVDVNPRNGLVSWSEYHQYFLNQRGLNIKENPDKVYSGLDRKTKESIMRDKAAWSEASRFNPDQLTVDEFLAFRHPESSHATILTLVEELFDKFDRDGDDILTEDEFAILHTFSGDEAESRRVDRGEEERRKEFQIEIDRNQDGKADRHELLMYIDPKNPRHAREEAQSLMSVADFNQDDKLSLSEVLNKMDLFLGSKMVDTAKSFHDEF